MTALAMGFHPPGLRANLNTLAGESHRRTAFGFDRSTTPSLRSSSEAVSGRNSLHFADYQSKFVFV